MSSIYAFFSLQTLFLFKIIRLGLDSEIPGNSLNRGGEDVQGQDEGLKSWPPRSALNIDDNQQKSKKGW